MKPIAVLDFETTLKCTHNCVYCYNAHKNHADYPMDELNTADTIVLLEKVIGQTKCKRFIFSGGEPFTRPDLRDLIKAVHATKTPMTIITNGALVETNDIQYVQKNGVDTFEITLLSANRTIHNQMTSCGVGENQKLYVMDMTGNIRLCNFSSTIVGNILQNDFWDIVGGNKAKAFMTAHPQSCNGCDKLNVCQGGCKASAGNCYGDDCAEDAFLREYKDSYKQIIEKK